MSKILVTGGAGFIGSNLSEALLKRGHRVRILDNFSTGKRENLNFQHRRASLEILEGDIRDFRACQRAMDGIEIVFHQAALPFVEQSVEDPLTAHAVNVDGTVHLLAAARDAQAKRFIYASSCAIYGDDPTLPKREEMVPNPLSPYALHKQVGEEYGRLFCRLYGLETISLRYFNVFGPKQDPNSIYSAVIPRFIGAILRGRPPVVFGDGEQSRDFVFIGDVVYANLLAMAARRVRGETVNIASGRRTALNQLLEVLGTILGEGVKPIYQRPRKGDIRHSSADIQKARRLLKYQPKTDLVKGLKETVRYFRSHFREG